MRWIIEHANNGDVIRANDRSNDGERLRGRIGYVSDDRKQRNECSRELIVRDFKFGFAFFQRIIRSDVHA